MKTVKFGIFGLGRGSSFYKSVLANGGEVVAVCDQNEDKLKAAKEMLGDGVTLYRDFDSFICHEGLEAVFLCNFFHEHAPYAIKALEKNINVLSECTSSSTMAESVALIRAQEKSKAIYALAENYPFMVFNQEMRRVYRGGTLGKVLFAEGEYNHPVDMYDRNLIGGLHPFFHHWRNYLPRTYYITHSLAPLMYITGSTPVRVSALPVHAPFPSDVPLPTRVDDRAAIITTLNDDDSVFRVTGCAAFGGHENSYRICAEKGQIENVRGQGDTVSLRYNFWQIPEGKQEINVYKAEWQEEDVEMINAAGHGGGDFFVIREFFRCIREKTPPVFDVYAATTMASVGILGHRSLLQKGVPYDIPDFHKEEERKKYENDTLSPFIGSNGEKPTLECSSHPKPEPTEEELKNYEKNLPWNS